MPLNTQPSISILVTTHKRPMLLKRALQSILNQQNTPLQSTIVLVSDTVCPKTDAVATQCLRPQDVYLRRNGPAGPARSRNLAQQWVNTTHYMFLDDDDSLHPTYFQKLAPILTAQCDTVFYTDIILITENQHPQDIPLEVNRQTISLANRQQDDLFYKNFIPNNCVVYPRACAAQHHTSEALKSQEDWAYLLSVASCNTLVHLPMTGACVHKRPADAQHRGGSADAKNTQIVADYLHIYRQWPAPTPRVKQARQQLMKTVWPAAPPAAWF